VHALNAGLERCRSPIVARMDADDVMHRERLASQGVDPQHNTPEEFSKLLASDVNRWAKVVQRLGLQVD